MKHLKNFLADKHHSVIMLDCETGSLKPNAAVTSVGAIKFCWSESLQELVSLESIYLQVLQLSYATEEYLDKFDVNLSTLEWRAEKLPPEEGPFLPLVDAASKLHDWSTGYVSAKPFFMMKPTKFDAPIIDNFCLSTIGKSPIDRHKLLDLETLFWGQGCCIKDAYAELGTKESSHHALEDCQSQIEALNWLLTNCSD